MEQMTLERWVKLYWAILDLRPLQGCIICSILPSRMGARGVSSKHVERIWRCFPVDVGKSRTVFFPSDTLIYGISRDGSKKF